MSSKLYSVPPSILVATNLYKTTTFLDTTISEPPFNSPSPPSKRSPANLINGGRIDTNGGRIMHQSKFLYKYPCATHVICYPYTCQSRDFYHIVNSILCQVSTRPIATPRQRQFCALEGCWLLKLNVKCMNELRPFQGSLFLQCKTIKSKQYKLAISLNELKVWLQISVIFRTVKQILLSHVTLFYRAANYEH